MLSLYVMLIEKSVNLNKCSVHLFPRQYFVNADDTVPEKVRKIKNAVSVRWCFHPGNWWNDMLFVSHQVVVQKDSPRGVHFRRAGPRQRVWCLRYVPISLKGMHNRHISDIDFIPFQVYFEPEDVKACIVTCGGLCPGLNTVIRELVCGLSHMYNVNDIFAIQVCAVLDCVKLLTARFHFIWSMSYSVC
jgi:hypothetical protein